MREALQETMPKEITWTKPSGGFFLWLKLPQELDSESFLEQAIRGEKVSYIIGRPFSYDNSSRNFLRLAYSVEDPKRIQEGIVRLARVIKGVIRNA
jgi:DNA-binding transcriptional MocR family regulator